MKIVPIIKPQLVFGVCKIIWLWHYKPWSFQHFGHVPTSWLYVCNFSKWDNLIGSKILPMSTSFDLWPYPIRDR